MEVEDEPLVVRQVPDLMVKLGPERQSGRIQRRVCSVGPGGIVGFLRVGEPLWRSGIVPSLAPGHVEQDLADLMEHQAVERLGRLGR